MLKISQKAIPDLQSSNELIMGEKKAIRKQCFNVNKIAGNLILP
jgi:hypothetical protein